GDGGGSNGIGGARIIRHGGCGQHGNEDLVKQAVHHNSSVAGEFSGRHRLPANEPSHIGG
ncbi:MAG TPA: hypothetical protein VK196_18555, partial [Magnetospirillum sp.]|nr:hypothetical protein [Magnetospirillum sp.]